MRVMLSTAIICFGTNLAQAQSVQDTSISTSAGKEVRLGAYATFKRDCSGGTAADLRPVGDQHGGVLVVSTGTLSTARVPGCATVTSPAHIIIYRPNPGFTGTDRVTFDVVDPATGGKETHSFTVTVAP